MGEWEGSDNYQFTFPSTLAPLGADRRSPQPAMAAGTHDLVACPGRQPFAVAHLGPVVNAACTRRPSGPGDVDRARRTAHTGPDATTAHRGRRLGTVEPVPATGADNTGAGYGEHRGTRPGMVQPGPDTVADRVRTGAQSEPAGDNAGDNAGTGAHTYLEYAVSNRLYVLDPEVMRQFFHGDTPTPVPQANAAETLAAVDATVEGRCAGPGCGIPLTVDSPSGWWCSDACQAAWQQRQAGSPSPGSAPVRGSGDVDSPLMRWRPDLVTAFDDTGWTLLDCHHRDDTGLDYRVYTDPESDRGFLRVDDGHRFVGVEVPWSELEVSGPSEHFRRLERELTDPRRLDNPPPRRSQADEARRDAIRDWLRANGIDPERVPFDAEIVCDGQTIQCNVIRHDARGRPVIAADMIVYERVSVPMVVLPGPVAGFTFDSAGGTWRMEGSDGQRYESHICAWELTERASWDWTRLRRRVVRYRCALRWSDGTRCDSTTTDPSAVRRAERLIGPSATGGDDRE